MPMIYDKVVAATNKIIESLNKEELSRNETIAVLGQLLIYTGASFSKEKIDFQNIDWDKLEKIYYLDEDDNDIGLGVMLNGGAIMQAIDDNFITSNVTAKEKENDHVPTTNQVPQKKRSTSGRPSKTKGRANTRRKNKN